ncbi:MAG: hypothetical protein GY834_11745 [Bacteroidetes bacterium]|nr:hypothetical protein [Bacteroidota bacterium]
MRKSLLILLCLSMSYYLMAQETVKQKEIGLVFSNLNNFGLTFKTGTDKSLWRFNTLFISGNNMDNTASSLVDKYSNMGFGVKIGKEYRKVLVDNLELRLGADLSFTYSYSQSKSEYDDKTVDDYYRLDEITTYQLGINLVFGFYYVVNENIVLGAELLPDFNYTTGESVKKRTYNNDSEEIKSDTSGFNYGLSNTYALLSIAYRF